MRQSGLRGWAQQFWRRVTEGLELNQLWTQFRTDARASYHLYSRDIDFTKTPGERGGRHLWNITKQFFWAILEQLSPARRVLLLLALVLLLLSAGVTWGSDHQEGVRIVIFDLRTLGGLLLLLLLILEVSDRVVMKRDLQIAREIQMWLVPGTPPTVPGAEIAFAARPANTVAGDYYDAFPRVTPQPGSPKFLFAMADVAGKSIPAALLMAGFQASLKTLSATPAALPSLVASLNHYACSNSQEGRRFITAFLGEFDPGCRTLTYINAGHNPPILRRSNGSIEHLEAGGMPLGVQENGCYEFSTVTLQPDDWLAIFTDGLVEAANEHDEEYGEQRVISILNSGPSELPANLISRLMVNLDIFVGNNLPLADDVTCMLVKINKDLVIG